MSKKSGSGENSDYRIMRLFRKVTENNPVAVIAAIASGITAFVLYANFLGGGEHGLAAKIFTTALVSLLIFFIIVVILCILKPTNYRDTVLLTVLVTIFLVTTCVFIVMPTGGGNGSAMMPAPSVAPTPVPVQIPDIEWSSHFGGPKTEHGYSAVQAEDGGYVIVGDTNSWDAGYEMYVVKTYPNGSFLRSTGFGGKNEDHAYSLCKTPDCGYMIVGDSTTWGENGDIYPVKVDADINYTWSGDFGGQGIEHGRSVARTSDGGYIIAGDTTSFTNGGSDLYAVKVDSKGLQLWSNHFGDRGDESGRGVEPANDGGYVIVGDTTSYGNGTDVCLAKIDRNCNPLWSANYGGPGDEHGYAVAKTGDGGYILVGDTTSLGNGSNDVYLVKVASGGAVQWSRTYGGSGDDHGRSLAPTGDGGYIIVGDTTSYTSGGSDIYVLKVSAAGDLQWSAHYGGPYDEHGRSIAKTGDGGYIIAGDTASYTNGDSDMYLLKMAGL